MRIVRLYVLSESIVPVVSRHRQSSDLQVHRETASPRLCHSSKHTEGTDTNQHHFTCFQRIVYDWKTAHKLLHSEVYSVIRFGLGLCFYNGHENLPYLLLIDQLELT